MFVLDPYLSAVSLLEGLEELSESPVFLHSEHAAPLWDVDVKLSVEVLLHEAISVVV